ncbi:MAG: ribonuclease T2 [Pseudomonadota bacterium]
MKASISTVACLLGLLLAALRPGPAAAEPFDYYVLALSWQPSWCAREGDERNAPSCRDGSAQGFKLHGLWPQHEDGWPEYCRTRQRDPARAETAAMADIMGSPGLAWHQWKKHGRCSGLPARDYFAASRAAYTAIRRPKALRGLDRAVRIDPDVVEEAFLEANPDLDPAAVVVTCRERMIAEVRICLDRDLEPRPCSGPAARACTRTATLPPLR